MINFFNEDIDFHSPLSFDNISVWLHAIASHHHFKIEELNYIFCSDQYLLQINQQYLNHNFFTDIITFDNSDSPDHLEGDIFISIIRLQENAKHYQETFLQEFLRVLSHGLLHLIGFNDKSPQDLELMRSYETHAIELYFYIFPQE